MYILNAMKNVVSMIMTPRSILELKKSPYSEDQHRNFSTTSECGY